MRMRIPQQDPIRFLVELKYPLYEREEPFNSSPELSKKIAADNTKGRKYYKQIAAKPKDEIDSLYEKEVERIKTEMEAAQYFNQPEVVADFDYWSKMSHWTLDEAIALSFGKDPKKVNWEYIKSAYDSDFVAKYSSIRELANRAKIWKKLFDPVLPTIFLRWVKNSELDFPKELEILVEKRHVALHDWKSSYDEIKPLYDKVIEERAKTLGDYSASLTRANEIIDQYKNALAKKNAADEVIKIDKPLNKKERDSMLKLMAGLLALNYNHHSIKNDLTKAKQVCDDILRDAGIEMNDDTVRKYLREAQPFLPDNLDELN